MTGLRRRLGRSSDDIAGGGGGSSSSRSTPSQQTPPTSWRVAAMVALATALVMFPSGASAFVSSVTMSYKPPVKSSVSKIRNSRYSSTGSELRRSSDNDGARSRSPTSKSAYAAALAPPPTTMQGPRSFEKRMRELVLGTTGAATGVASAGAAAKRNDQASVAASTKPANILTVETLADYKKVVADEKERIVAVRFHSPWCRACKAMAPAFYHLAKQHPDTLFVDVPVTADNANLHQGLGVPSLPYGHLYVPGRGLVEELRITKKLMPDFQQTLESYIQAREEEEESTITSNAQFLYP